MYMDWTEIVSAKRKNNGILKFNMGYDDKTLHSLKTVESQQKYIAHGFKKKVMLMQKMGL